MKIEIIESQIICNDLIENIRKNLGIYFLEEDKQKHDIQVKKDYLEYSKSKGSICLSLKEYKAEVNIIQEYQELIHSKDGEILQEEIPEITEKIREFTPKENYNQEIEEYLSNSSLYKNSLHTQRTKNLNKLEVTTSTNKTFNANKSSIEDLGNAIKSSELYKELKGIELTETQWRLTDNKFHVVTLAEVKEAYLLANMQYSQKFAEYSKDL